MEPQAKICVVSMATRQVAIQRSFSICDLLHDAESNIHEHVVLFCLPICKCLPRHTFSAGLQPAQAPSNAAHVEALLQGMLSCSMTCNLLLCT